MSFKPKLKENYARLETPVKEFLGKLTLSQRVSLGILGSVVMVLLGSIIFFSGSSSADYQIPIDARGKLPELLDERSIDYRQEGEQVYVDARDLNAVRAAAISLEFDQDEDAYSWLFQDQNWSETSGQRHAKLQYSRQKQIESTIRAIPQVKSASVVHDLKDEPKYLRSQNPSTCSVDIKTKGSGLPTKVSRSIQRFVAGSLGIETSNVMVMVDGIGLDFDDPLVQISDSKAAHEQKYRKMAEEHLAISYPRTAYRVTADVELSRISEERLVRSVNADDSLTVKERVARTKTESETAHEAPGVKPNVVKLSASGGGRTRTTNDHEETEFETEFGTTESKQVIQPGEVTAVAITVSLAEEAIAVVLAKRRGDESYTPTQSDIADEAERVERQITGLRKSGIVSAQVVPVTLRASLFPSPEPPPDAVLGFIQTFAREIVLAVLAVVGCLLLYRAAGKSVPELEPLPDPVADLQQFLVDKEERDRKLALEEEDGTEDQREVFEWEATEEDREALELLKAVTEFAVDRPELAGTVVRNWLNEMGEPNGQNEEEPAV